MAYRKEVPAYRRISRGNSTKSREGSTDFVEPSTKPAGTSTKRGEYSAKPTASSTALVEPSTAPEQVPPEQWNAPSIQGKMPPSSENTTPATPTVPTIALPKTFVDKEGHSVVFGVV